MRAEEAHLLLSFLGIPLGYLRGRMVRIGHLIARFLEVLTRDCRWKQQGDKRLAPLNALQFSVWISRGAGLVLSVDTMMILLPMCRNILRYIRPKARWLPLDESIWFHRQVAYAMLMFTIVHTSAHYVKYVKPKKIVLQLC